MVQVIVSKEKLDELMGLKEPFDVCDESGRIRFQATITQFTQKSSTVSTDLDRIEYSTVECPFTDEELDEAALQQGRTTAEVLQHLHSLRPME